MHICNSCNTRAIYHYEENDGSFSFCKVCMMKKLYDFILTDADYPELTVGEIRSTLIGKCRDYPFKPTVSY